MPRESLEGVAALLKQLGNLKDLDGGQDLRKAIRAGIVPAFKRAQASIPVFSGVDKNNKASFQRLAPTYGGIYVNYGYAKQALRIRTKLSANKQVAESVLGVLKPAFYALNFVEHGTRYQRANHWLTNAFVGARNDGETAIRDYLVKAVNKAIKKS